jgi:cell wall-associated NlpC family hydrolase
MSSMKIKNWTKKLVVTSFMAGSLFVLPQLAPHHASAATVSISTTHQVLKSGSLGSSVKAVQTKLRLLGFFHDSIDGRYGSHTKSAVIAFQKKNHLSADGIAGPSTLGKLFSKYAVSNKTSNIVKVQSVSLNSTASLVSSIISDGEALQGISYRWGGKTPSGFDCSGFTGYVFNKSGIKLPRTAAQQYAAGKPVSSPQPGDLVFFRTYSSGPSHTGIFIGNNEFISATSSHGIAMASMDNSYWKPRYLGARTFTR